MIVRIRYEALFIRRILSFGQRSDEKSILRPETVVAYRLRMTLQRSSLQAERDYGKADDQCLRGRCERSRGYGEGLSRVATGAVSVSRHRDNSSGAILADLRLACYWTEARYACDEQRKPDSAAMANSIRSLPLTQANHTPEKGRIGDDLIELHFGRSVLRVKRLFITAYPRVQILNSLSAHPRY